MSEVQRVKSVYRNRSEGDLYSLLRPEVSIEYLSRLRVLHKYLNSVFGADVKDLKLLDVGCGFGDWLLDFVRLGFSPRNLVGVDILEERLLVAGRRLSSDVRLICDDIVANPLLEKFDIINISLVFSSIIDDKYRAELMTAVMHHLSPDGIVLIYDFRYSNPYNREVRPLTIADIKMLLQGRRFQVETMTIAPPISRFVAHHLKFLLQILNKIPLFRTHHLFLIRS